MLDVIIIVGISLVILICLRLTDNSSDEAQDYEIELTDMPRISVEYNGVQYVPPQYI